MTDSEVDTETLIALVSSIVNDRLPQIETSSVLDAILRCDGDVHSAASYLLQNHTTPVDPKGKKRAHSGLDAWLQRGAPSPKRRKDSERPPEPTDSVLTRPRHSSPAKPRHPPNIPNLLSILQPPTTNTTNTNISSPKKPLSSSSSSRKPKPPSSIPRLPPLTLPSPAMVAQHTPCTLHPAVLPPALACRLFYTMLDRARAGWTRNRWWLFERMVESPHRTAFFVRKDLGGREDADADAHDREWTEAARYWYNGTPTEAPPVFPPEMEEACYIIERVVNAEMRKRRRFDMEWRPPSQSHTPSSHTHPPQSDTHPPPPDTHPSQSGTREPLWRANVAASNCYEGGKESVGWHSDLLTYLGPCPTIASLSLGTRRTFSLRDVVPADEQETRHARTYNIPLPHNSLIIMHATTQERFKHAVPPQRAVDVYKPVLPRSAFGLPPSSSSSKHGEGGEGEKEGEEKGEGVKSSSSSSPVKSGGRVKDGEDGDDKIEPSNVRINITFRFYRPDFRPARTPRCRCGVPMILRPDMKNTMGMRDTKVSKPGGGGGGGGGSGNGDEKGGGGSGNGNGSGEGEGEMKYWWTCYAYAQNEGKGCGLWKVMDLHAEGRGWRSRGDDSKGSEESEESEESKESKDSEGG